MDWVASAASLGPESGQRLGESQCALVEWPPPGAELRFSMMAQHTTEHSRPSDLRSERQRHRNMGLCSHPGPNMTPATVRNRRAQLWLSSCLPSLFTGNPASCTFLVVNKSHSNAADRGKPSRDHLTPSHLAGVVAGLGNSWWLGSHLGQELLAAFRFPEDSHLAKSRKGGRPKPEVVASSASTESSCGTLDKWVNLSEHQHSELYKCQLVFED